MSCENSNNIENSDVEINYQNIEKLFDNSGVAPKWMKHEIVAKLGSVMDLIEFDMELKAKEKFKKKIEENMSEEECLSHSASLAFKTFEDSIGSGNETLQKFIELRQIFSQRMQVMTVYIDKQLDPKIDHCIKLNNGMMRKIGDLNTVMEKMEASHVEQMTGKNQELEMCEVQISNIEQMITEAQKKLEDISAEIEVENMKMASAKAAFMEVQDLICKTDSIIASLAHLASEIEVKNDASKILRDTEETIRSEISFASTKIIQLELESEAAKSKSEFLNKRLDEINQLMNLLNQMSEAKEMKKDPVFQREVMGNSYFNEHMKKLDQEIRDNEDINNDFGQVMEQVQEQKQKIEVIEKEVEKLTTTLTEHQSEINEVGQNAKSSKIQERLKQEQDFENALKAEISDLKAKIEQEKEDLVAFRKVQVQNIAQWNINLRQEQEKTRKARHQQKMSVTANKKDFNIKSSEIATISQPSGSAKQSQLPHPAVNPHEPMSQPLKRPFEMSKRFDFLRRSATYSVESIPSQEKKARIEDFEEPRTNEGPSLPTPGKENKFLYNFTNKKPLEEKPFESFDSSFEFSFNTDIEDMLEA